MIFTENRHPLSRIMPWCRKDDTKQTRRWVRPLPRVGGGGLGWGLSPRWDSRREPPPASLGSAPSPASGRGKASPPLSFISHSPARRAGPRKTLADPHRQGVADLAIGLELPLAVTLGAGGVMGRPLFRV